MHFIERTLGYLHSQSIAGNFRDNFDAAISSVADEHSDILKHISVSGRLCAILWKVHEALL